MHRHACACTHMHTQTHAHMHMYAHTWTHTQGTQAPHETCRDILHFIHKSLTALFSQIICSPFKWSLNIWTELIVPTFCLNITERFCQVRKFRKTGKEIRQEVWNQKCMHITNYLYWRWVICCWLFPHIQLNILIIGV